MSIGTTNIDELPSNNVKNEIIENNSHDYNTLVKEIQHASSNGSLQLPSKDIPMSQEHIVKDVNTQPNYIEPPKEKDYIQEENVSAVVPEKNLETTTDFLLEEFQTPILITICFVLFQTPLINDKFVQLLPSMFKNDLNLKTSGIILQGLLFGLFYYCLNRSMLLFLE